MTSEFWQGWAACVLVAFVGLCALVVALSAVVYLPTAELTPLSDRAARDLQYATAGGEGGLALVVEAVAGEQGLHVGEGPGGDLVDEVVGNGVLALGHPDLRPPARREPGAEAEMVGMEMGDEDARDGTAAEMPGEDRLPGRAGLVEAEAAIDDGPALAADHFGSVDGNPVEHRADRVI